MEEEFNEDEELGGEELKVPVYDDLVQEEPEREVDLDEIDIPQTLSEAEEETEQVSDLKLAMKLLTPKLKSARMNELLQPAMVSRIFPDNYLDKNYLIVMSLIEEQEGDDEIDVVGIISTVQDLTSIGYEGRGREDLMMVAGVVREEELEKLSKELGV